MTLGKHGVTQQTAENIPLGAGTWHKNLRWNSETQAWEGACVGATQGGGKISIQGEYLQIELDGALVKVKGLTVKQGGAAKMEINMAEFTGDTLQLATNFKKGTSDAQGYDLYIDKPDLEEGDYVENFGFVGRTAKGKMIIVIFEYALCTESFEFEPKGKENAVLKATLEAYAENRGDLDTLPVKIYYPSATAAAATAATTTEGTTTEGTTAE